MVKAELGITDEDFELYIGEEKKYLRKLTEPPLETTLKIQYIRALRELFQCRCKYPTLISECVILNFTSQEWDLARAAANQVLVNVAPRNLHAVIFQAHRRVKSAFTQLQNAESFVSTLETNLNIQEHWTASSAEYQKFHHENVRTNYREALDELECLVMMCLFELAKISTSGLGT